MQRLPENGFAPLEISPALKHPKFLRAQTSLKTRSILGRRPAGSGGLFPTGFTILELVVVSSIIGIIASVTLANFAQVRRSQALGRTAQKLAFDIRRAQTLALGGVNMGPPGPQPRNICAYGIFIRNPTSYLIFGNRYTGNNINSCSGSYRSNGGPEREDIIVDGAPIILENGITITSGNMDIAFRPPRPVVLVGGGGSPPVTITLQDDSGNKRCITITTTGQVNIAQGGVCL